MRRSLKIVGFSRFADREEAGNSQAPAAPSNRSMRKNVSFHSMGVVKSSAKFRRHSWSGFSSKSTLRANRSHGMIFAAPRGGKVSEGATSLAAQGVTVEGAGCGADGQGVVFVPDFTRPRTISTPAPAAASLHHRLQRMHLGSHSSSFSEGCGERGSSRPGSGAAGQLATNSPGGGSIQKLKAAMQDNQGSASNSGTLAQHRSGSGRGIFFIDYFDHQRSLRLSGLYRRSADGVQPGVYQGQAAPQNMHMHVDSTAAVSCGEPPLLRRSYSSGAAEDVWRAPGPPVGKRAHPGAGGSSARDMAPMPVALPLTPGGTPKLGGLSGAPLVRLAPLPAPSFLLSSSQGASPAHAPAPATHAHAGAQLTAAASTAAPLIRPAAVSWPWLDSSWGSTGSQGISTGGSGRGRGGPGVGSETSTLSSGSSSDSGGNEGVWGGPQGQNRPRSNTVGGVAGIKAGEVPSVPLPGVLVSSLSLPALPVPGAAGDGEEGREDREVKRVRPLLQSVGLS